MLSLPGYFDEKAINSIDEEEPIELVNVVRFYFLPEKVWIFMNDLILPLILR